MVRAMSGAVRTGNRQGVSQAGRFLLCLAVALACSGAICGAATVAYAEPDATETETTEPGTTETEPGTTETEPGTTETETGTTETETGTTETETGTTVTETGTTEKVIAENEDDKESAEVPAEPVVVVAKPDESAEVVTYSPTGELLSTTAVPEVREVKAISLAPYSSVTNNSYSEIAAQTLWKVPFGGDYVFWRSGQYQYCFAYGDIGLSGSTFNGSSVDLVTYTLDSSYSGTYRIAHSKQDITLNAGDYIVFSNLGVYPLLDAQNVFQKLALWSACVGLVMVFCRSVFSFTLRMGVRAEYER